MRLQDKVAIVTGGGRGIGRDIALAYAREGAQVVVAEIDPQTAEATAAEAVFLACDESRYATGSVLGADGGQAVGYFLTVPERRFSGGRID